MLLKKIMKKRVYFLIKEILTIHSLLSSSSEGVTKVNFSVAFRSLTSLAKCRFLALSRDFRRQMRHMKMKDNTKQMVRVTETASTALSSL